MVQKSVTYDCKLYCERVKKKKKRKVKTIADETIIKFEEML